MNIKIAFRKFVYKYIHIGIVALLMLVTILLLIFDKDLAHDIATDAGHLTLFILFLVSLLCTLLSVVVDMKIIKKTKKDYKDLEYRLYSDYNSGIASRYMCDAVINQYKGERFTSDISCVMLAISNIHEINDKYGHDKGTEAIAAFSKALVEASKDLCFSGRNSGNQFLAIFADGSKENIELYLSRIKKKISEHNINSEITIEYSYGVATEKEEKQIEITDLISIADSRLLDNELDEKLNK